MMLQWMNWNEAMKVELLLYFSLQCWRYKGFFMIEHDHK